MLLAVAINIREAVLLCLSLTIDALVVRGSAPHFLVIEPRKTGAHSAWRVAEPKPTSHKCALLCKFSKLLF